MWRCLLVVLAFFVTDCGAFSASDESPPGGGGGGTRNCVFDDPASKLDECTLTP